MTEAEWLACDDPRPMLGFVRGRASERKLRLLAAGCCRCLWPLLEDARARHAVEAAEAWADGRATPEGLAAARAALQAALAPARLRAMREADREGLTLSTLAFHADHAAGAARAAACVAEAPGGPAGDPLRRRFRRRAEWGALLAAAGAIDLPGVPQGADLTAAAPPAARCALIRDVFRYALTPLPLLHASLLWGATTAEGPPSAEARYRSDIPAPADGPPAGSHAVVEDLPSRAAIDFSGPLGRGGEGLTAGARDGGKWLGLARSAYEGRALPSGHLDPARLSALAGALEVAGCSDAGLLAHLRSPGPHVRGCWAVDLILGKQ